jgi:hypothetical protein
MHPSAIKLSLVFKSFLSYNEHEETFRVIHTFTSASWKASSAASFLPISKRQTPSKKHINPVCSESGIDLNNWRRVWTSS